MKDLDKSIDDALKRTIDEWYKDPLNYIREQIILGQSAARAVELLENERLEWLEEEAQHPKYYRG